MAATTSKKRILLVDDNQTNLDIFREIFEERYSLEIATTGREALSKLQDFSPNLVLLDVMMPGINGYETCRQMRQLPKGRAAKILMISAKTLSSEKSEGLRAGADDYLIKPFDIDDLKDRCLRHLS